MSSSTPSRTDGIRRSTRVLLLTATLVLLLVGAPGVGGAATPAGTAAVPAGTWDGRSRLTVTLPTGTLPTGSLPTGTLPTGSRATGGDLPGAVSVTVSGRAVPADVVPLPSERTATALVVDTSAAGASALQPGISGAADVVLAAPPAARTALVADTSPPTLLSALRAGPADTLRGLAQARPGGVRQTGAALDLALAQLPPEADRPRLVLLYTGAPDTPVPAADLAARLAAAGAVLAVVVPTDDGTVPVYWSELAGATGGTAVAAPRSGVVAAFDEVSTALRTRYLVSFPAPDRLPADAVVHVDTPAGPITLGAEAAAPAAAVGPAGGTAWLGVGGALLAALAAAVLVAAVVRRRSGRRTPAVTPDIITAWNVPDRPDPVVDRRRQAATLRGELRPGRPVLLRAAGDVPGTGTTTAMIEFAHRERADYDIAWWVPAADAPLVVDRLAELAEALGLAAPDDSAEAATQRLLTALRERRRWLLIFDDAGSPRQLTRFLPGGAGHVLVGSPDPEWARHATVVTVGPFSRAESTGLLRSRRPGLAADEAGRVAAAVADVPLAVDLAGATLAETAMDADGYLRLLTGHAPAADPAPTTEAVCAVALDRLAVDEPAAATLLTLLAWLGPDPVPLSLLTARPDLLPAAVAPLVAAPARWEGLLAVVRRRGLARVDAHAVVLHRVPAGLLVARSADGEDAATWAATAVRLLRDALPADPTDPAGRAVWRRLLPHVLVVTDPGRQLDGVTVEVGWLLHQAGRHLSGRGEPRAAHALFEDAYELYRRRLGPDHPDTVAAARTLA